MKTSSSRWAFARLSAVSLLATGLFPPAATAQTAYYSVQGAIAADADTADLLFDLSGTVSNIETFQARTYSHFGGTNAAGDLIAGGSFNPGLTLVDDSGNGEGANVDGFDDGVNHDSWLSWDGVAPNGNGSTFGGDITSDSLPADGYVLNLRRVPLFAVTPGPWALDFESPAGTTTLTGLVPNGTTTFGSLKLGTTGAGSDPARATIDSGTFALSNSLILASTGGAVFNVETGGTVNVGTNTLVRTGGTLNLNGGTFTSGLSFTLDGGTLNLNDGNHTVPTIFSSTGGSLSVDSGSNLTLSGPSLFNNSNTISGLGRLTTNGSVTFTGPGTNTVTGVVLDLDGNTGGGTTINITNTDLDMDVQSLDIIDNDFGGTINFNNADLTVQTDAGAWTMSGMIDIDNPAAQSTITGDHLNLTGDINLLSNFSGLRVFSPLTISGAGGMSFNLNASAHLDGPTVFNPTFPLIIDNPGHGVLSQNGDLTVDADTAIEMFVYDLDGLIDTTTTTLNADLDIDVDRIESTLPANNDYDGTLNINDNRLTIHTGAGEWTMRGVANITANDTAAGLSSIAGDHLMVEGSIAVTAPGPGLSFVASIDAPVTFGDGAALSVDEHVTFLLEQTTVFDSDTATITGLGSLSQRGNATVNADTTIALHEYDLDGGSFDEASRIVTVNGAALTVNADSLGGDGSKFDGTLNLNNPATLDINLTIPAEEPRWRLAGTLNVTPVGGDTADINGSTVFFLDGSTTNIAGASTTLVLNAPAIVESGATFNGPGNVTTNNSLELRSGASVGVDVTANDVVGVGDSPGLATVASLTLGGDAAVELEVQAPSPLTGPPIVGVDYDRLVVTGDVALDGELRVQLLNDGTLPNLGTEYPVLTYGNRIGMFETVTGTLINTSLALAPLITDSDDPDEVDDSLVLRASIPGDLNMDDTVSVADLSTFALNFNTAPGLYVEGSGDNSWELGDFNADGAITVADLSLLALNFGFGVDPAAADAALTFEAASALIGFDLAALPEPSVIALLAPAFAGLVNRRQGRFHL